MSTKPASVALDLGVGDVHSDAAGGFGAPPKRKTMAEITTKTRNALPAGKFADPAKRRYPIENKAHADNAMARLEGNKANEPDYAAIKARIVAAQRRFGEGASDGPRRKGRVSIRASIGPGGHLSVRHMTDAEVHAPGCELDAVALSDAEPKKQVWIQLAKPGSFYKDGPFTLDDKVFGDVIRNFNATVNHSVPIDFEHASEMPASAGTIPMLGAPAQGWIKAIELRDGNLYGLVEWGELARDYIKAGQYKYISPAIRFGAKDPRTNRDIGAKLTSAALTNKPFLDGMRAVAASDTVAAPRALDGDQGGTYTLSSTGCYSTSEYMPQVKACLKMPELATAKDCKDQLGLIKEHLAAAGGDHTQSPQGVPLGDYLKPMRQMSGVGMGGTWDDVFDVMDDLIDAAMDEHEIAYHGGIQQDEPDEAQATDADPATINATDGGPEEDTNTMSDANEITKQLTDAKAQVITLTDKVALMATAATAQETATAGLTLKLKDAESKGVDAAAKIADLEKTNKELTEKLAGVEAKRLSDRVDVAFATYKDSQKLTEAHKKMMVLTLRDDPKTFDELYPAVDPSKQHLLRDVTPARPTTATTTVTNPNEVPDMKASIAKLMKDDPKLTLEDAIGQAYSAIRQRLNGAVDPNVVS